MNQSLMKVTTRGREQRPRQLGHRIREGWGKINPKVNFQNGKK